MSAATQPMSQSLPVKVRRAESCSEGGASVTVVGGQFPPPACLGIGILPGKDRVISSGKRSIKITGALFLPPVLIIYLLILASELTL